ncbi:MAG: DNRLRE domain-containing protein [bacterium]
MSILAEARQAGAVRDLYAEPFTVNQPLQFVRDGKVIEIIRPVEAFVVDTAGEILESSEIQFRTAQLWQLAENGPGVAETSVHLGDVANAPDGDLLIDPTATFDPATQDTLLGYNSGTNYGSDTSLLWFEDDHLVFGFDVDGDVLEANKGIISATLEFYEWFSSIESNVQARAHYVLTDWDEASADWYDPWANDGGDYLNPAFQSPAVTLPDDHNAWVKLDVTAALKIHYASGGLSDVDDKGFLVRMEDETGGKLKVYTSEYTGDTSKRPILRVTYSMPTFGADAGAAYDYTGDPQRDGWTMDLRQKNMKADRLLLIRHLSGSTDPVGFMGHAEDNGMNVIYCIAAGTKNASHPVTPSAEVFDTADDYADYVVDLLDNVSDYIDGTISRTVIAAELGNEEDNEYKWSANGGGDYAGGHDFAGYYVAARKEVKQRWPGLEILSGGSLTWHRAFHQYVPPNEIGDSGRAFLCGFIDGVTEAAISDATGTYDYLPDTIAIHAWPNQWSPEDWEDNEGDQKGSWLHRLASLVRCCTERGCFPAFAITEYGYSPTDGNDWAPSTGASETAQAVYFLRRCLLNGTIRVPGVNWKYSLYQHHPRTPADVGFHDTDDYPGASRAIRYVAREIFSPTAARLLPNGKIWCPLQTKDEANDIYTAWGGWKEEGGDYWGAIWRFKHLEDYVEPTGAARYFVVDGNYEDHDAQRYRFTISDGAASYGLVGNVIEGDYSNGKTTWSIPDVDENPTFIRFYH